MMTCSMPCAASHANCQSTNGLPATRRRHLGRRSVLGSILRPSPPARTTHCISISHEDDGSIVVELKSHLAQALGIHRGAKPVGIFGVEQQESTGPSADQLPTKSSAFDPNLVPMIDCPV